MTDKHAAVEVTWSVYQQMIAAYRHPDRKQGLTPRNQLIDTLRRGVPSTLSELITLSPDPAPPSRRRPRLPPPARHQQRPHRGHL